MVMIADGDVDDGSTELAREMEEEDDTIIFSSLAFGQRFLFFFFGRGFSWFTGLPVKAWISYYSIL